MQKKLSILLLLLLFSLSLSIGAKDIYVSPEGSKNPKGTKKSPYGSIEEARDAARLLRSKGEISKGIAIVLMDGDYSLAQALLLNEKDSGTEQEPFVIKAQHTGCVAISTAISLSNNQFRAANAKEKSYLHVKAKDNVLVAELDQHAASCFGPGQGDYGALSWNEHLLQLAQWPNQGYNIIDKVLDYGPTHRWLKVGEKVPEYSFEKPSGGKFTMKEQSDFQAWNAELQRTKDILTDGYVSIDWAKYQHQIARVSDDGVFQLLNDTRYGVGGVKCSGSLDNPKPKRMKNRRMFFMNVLCELDMPGEWYFDRTENKLYLWPIGDMAEANISIPSGPLMLDIKGAKHIAIQGIVFENGGANVMDVKESSYIEFAGCTFRNLAGRVGELDGSNLGFVSCDFYNMNACMSITGGDYKTLTKANNYIRNCDFHDFKEVGYGALSLVGCGMEFTNNIYHRISSGLWYSGMYITFKNNEFFDVGWGMGDWNTLYQGADIWCNGNLIENNFFHHMFGFPGIAHPIVAVRNDDGGSGTTYKSNVFYKTGKGGIVAMGPSCHIIDNIAVECQTIWRTNKRPVTPEDVAAERKIIADMFESGKYPRGDKQDKIYNAESVLGEKAWDKEPFLTAFPDFSKYMNSNPFAQSYSSVLNSYCDMVDEEYPYSIYYVHGSWQLTDGDGGVHHQQKMEVTFPKTFKYNAPKKVTKRDFKDISTLDFTFNPDVELFEGSVTCDMSKVGLYKDEFRTEIANADDYRSDMYQKYKFRITDATGLNYNADNNKYFPTPSWMESPVKAPTTAFPYLSGMEDMGWMAYKPVRHDMNFRGETISIAGETFETGLVLAADKDKNSSEIAYYIGDTDAKRLAVKVGVDESYVPKEVVFVVKGMKNGEWTDLYTTKTMTKADKAESLEVNIEGYESIKLVSLGEGTAVWADAKLVE